MAVVLAHRHLGGAGQPPLVVLHGLLGSSRNWGTAGRRLAAHFEVFALDLRNHGASPHAAGLGFAALAADVAAWLDAQGLKRVVLVGHSLGGKVAMRLAADRPELLELLVVVDIAPKAYPAERPILSAMRDLDLAAVRSRGDAEAALAVAIPDPATRLFVLTNLMRGEDGRFVWQVGLDELIAGSDDMSAAPLAAGEGYAGPTLVLVGRASPYVGAADEALINRHFSQAEILRLPGGHNLHVDATAAFVEAVVDAASRNGVL